MGAVFAAVIRVPITSILLIFEMTYNYEIILPLMVANAIAYAVASRLTPLSIYEAFMFQDGIHLGQAPKTDVLSGITAASVMTQDVVTLPSDITVREALDIVGLRIRVLQNAGVLPQELQVLGGFLKKYLDEFCTLLVHAFSCATAARREVAGF